MKHCLLRLVSTVTFIAIAGVLAYGQGGATSSLTGVVLDSSGSVIPGADVTVKNNAVGAEFKALTADNGTFSIPALDPGTYTVTVSLSGFKQAVVKDVKLDTGVPATVRVTLEVGEINQSVIVQGGALIGYQVVIRQITVAGQYCSRQRQYLRLYRCAWHFTSADRTRVLQRDPGGSSKRSVQVHIQPIHQQHFCELSGLEQPQRVLQHHNKLFRCYG
jgi:hypothetical protein